MSSVEMLDARGSVIVGSEDHEVFSVGNPVEPKLAKKSQFLARRGEHSGCSSVFCAEGSAMLTTVISSTPT
jgi:hypothetical protein